MLDHDGGAAAPVPTRTVAEWPAGSFLENLVPDADGHLLVSVHSDRAVDHVDPATGVVFRLTVAPVPLAGLAWSAEGIIWASGGVPGTSPGSIWRIVPGQAPTLWCEIQDALFLNGMTWAPDGRLLVADSLIGTIFAVSTSEPTVSIWLAHDLLRPAEMGATPGANGIKLFGGEATISNTDRNLLLRVPLGPDGAAGTPRILAERLRADDFAIGMDGSLFIATHPANSVTRLFPDGRRATLAGLDDGAVNPTAVAFGMGADAAAVFVTTTGGVAAPPANGLQPARLLRLSVEIEGASLRPD